MTRRIDIDHASGDLVIRFDYDEALVALVRGLVRRRWSGDDRAWFVPIADVRAVIRTLGGRGFSMTARVQSALEAAPPEAEVATGSAAGSAMTLSQLNASIQRAVKAHFSRAVWVVGEISGLKTRGDTVYLELVERQGDAAAAARIDAMIFAAAGRRIADTLRRSQAGVELANGVQVCVRARVDVYVRTGRTQLIIEDIDPLHTLGKLAQQRERILVTLRESGLIGRNLALADPALPLRVGLVTSADSEAYNDFINELARSGFGFEVALADVPVQGRHVERAVSDALTRFAQMDDPPDVLVIIRGGGAKTDLAWFDSLAIAEAVCRHPVPVVVGIGHYRDRTVLDEIARSTKTPTAAAGYAIALVQRAQAAVAEVANAIEVSSRHAIASATDTLETAGLRLHREVRHKVAVGRRELDHLRTDLEAGSARRLKRSATHLEREQAQLVHLAKIRLRGERRVVALAIERFEPTRYQSTLDRQRAGLAELEGRLTRSVRAEFRRARERLDSLDSQRGNLDPVSVLRRGFAIVRRADGGLLTTARQVEPGDPLSVQLSDGRLAVRVLQQEADP